MTDDSKVIQLRVVDGNPQLIDLTREELTVISDVLRRLEPIRRGQPAAPVSIFVTRPAFATALAKIDDAKAAAWGAEAWAQGEDRPAPRA